MGNYYFRMHLIWSHVVWITPNCFAIEACFKNSDRVQTKSWSYKEFGYAINLSSIIIMVLKMIKCICTNFDQGSILLHDLIVSKPNSIIEDTEGENMINEGLAFWVVIRCPKYLHKHFLHHLIVWRSLERGIER